MSFTLPKLPYEYNALEPFISEETLHYHYDKHHNTYVVNLNKLIENTEYANDTLEDIILKAEGGLFNNAAQVWNHSFYWNCLSPVTNQQPSEELLAEINKYFGSFEEFKKQFSKAAATQFGSGWAWLVKNQDNALEIMQTSNADTPTRHNKIPLLTCDVWEHAYYIDYRNARPKYIDAFWNIVNWEFASNNFVNK